MGRPKASEADPLRKAKRGRPSKHKRDEHVVVHTGFDGHANAPWRKTVSIFKQPVTLVHTSGRDTKKGTEQQLKRGLTGSRSQEKPAPVMWAKALENVQALIPTAVADKVDVNKTEYLTESLHLAGRLEKASNILSEQAAAATLFTSIHNPNQSGAFGQTADKEKLESNLMLHVNPDQPLLRPVTVQPDDITAQERRVLDARKRLQEVIKHFG
ncbi:Methyl-CpG-binding domain protein 2 [Trichostrongylus colubriformis]|uniref:Methyl-CpG-binding domain protein 2 n=1 Tax=Trichostrongylus colubriformis TaxID=6319 RepID=A0AAN8J2P3_TRICO